MHIHIQLRVREQDVAMCSTDEPDPMFGDDSLDPFYVIGNPITVEVNGDIVADVRIAGIAVTDPRNSDSTVTAITPNVPYDYKVTVVDPLGRVNLYEDVIVEVTLITPDGDTQMLLVVNPSRYFKIDTIPNQSVDGYFVSIKAAIFMDGHWNGGHWKVC